MCFVSVVWWLESQKFGCCQLGGSWNCHGMKMKDIHSVCWEE